GASTEYSDTELAGVPCKLFVNLIWTNYTTQLTMMISFDRFLVFTLGGCCITGEISAAFGALNGLRMGLSETKNMAWILNLVTRQGVTWANTLGSVGECLVFGDNINTVVAGTMTGMLYKSTVQKVKHSIIKVIIGTQGVTITWLYILYIQNNMDTPSN
uniref:Uncharacterized protein n=1 Tax=Oncorhynchus kisutch TaxID=8019 RepID=A0A8C7CFV7_ONCKI